MPFVEKVVNAYLNAVKTPDDLQSDALPSLPPDRDFIKTVETLISGAFLLGLFHAAEEQGAVNAADGTDIPPIPFSEAVGFLKSKVPMTKTEWLSLEKKMRFRAFTMAKLGEVKVIETVKKQLVKAMEGGEGFAGSFDTIKAIAKASDATLTPFYWETVFRTNVQSAYVAGKLLQYQKFPPAAYRLLVIEDVRTSDICRHLLTQSGYGVVMPVDHPFWEKYGFPPYHMNCRTGISAVYDSQVGRDGNNVENRSMKSFEKFKVQDGFGGNPIEKESWWRLTDSMKMRIEQYGLWQQVEDFAHSIGIKNYDILLAHNELGKRQLGHSSFHAQLIDGADPKPHEVEIAKILEDNGHKVLFTPENTFVSGIKNPEGLLTDVDKIIEMKRITSPQLVKVSDRMKETSEQNAEIGILHLLGDKKYSTGEAIERVRDTFKEIAKANKPSRLQEVWLIKEGKIIKVKK